MHKYEIGVYNKKIETEVDEIKTTMIIYESHYGNAKKAAMMLGTIIGNTKVYPVDEAPDPIDYNNLIVVFGFYGPGTAASTITYLQRVKDQIGEKPMAVVGIGLAESDLPGFCEKIRDAARGKEFEMFFAKGELRISELTDVERKQLERFFKKLGIQLENKDNFATAAVAKIAGELAMRFRTTETPMPKDRLKEKIEEFIKSHNTMALATGKDDWVRCTSLEYIYLNEMFYIITEGGLKYQGLWQNKNISAAIYDAYHTMANLKGLQITGKAAFVEIMSDEYQQVFSERHVSLKKLDQLTMNLYLIRISPVKYEMLNSDFKKDGFDTKQILELI